MLIDHALTTTANRNDHLKEKVNEMRLYIKQNFLLSLIHGNMKVLTDGQLESVGLNWQGKFYCVMAMVSKRLGGFPVHIKPVISSQSILPIDTTQEGSYMFVVNLKTCQDEEVLRAAEHILDSLGSDRDQVILGVGNTYQKLIDIKYSYVEAMSALDFNKKVTGRTIYFFGQVSQHFSDFYWYPSSTLLRLTQAIKQGDRELSVELLHQLKKNIEEKKLSFLNERLICYDVVNVLMKSVNDMKLKLIVSEYHSFGVAEQRNVQLRSRALRGLRNQFGSNV